MKRAETTKIKLRPCCLSDIPLLEYWDRQAHVIASDPNDDWHWEFELDRRPDWRSQCIAELSGRPIGFVQIIDPAREDSHYWGDVPGHVRAIDIWIGEATDLRKGYGTTIMHCVLARCFSDPEVMAVWVDPLESNTGAHRFYEKLGFQLMARRRFGQDDCFVYQLARPHWNKEHMEIR